MRAVLNDKGRSGEAPACLVGHAHQDDALDVAAQGYEINTATLNSACLLATTQPRITDYS